MGKISIGGKEFFGSVEFPLEADTSTSDQPGDDSSFITDMGVGPLTIRVKGDCTEETDSLSDVRKEIMTVGELSLILDTGWEYRVFRRSFRPVRIAGTKQTGLNGYHNEFDAVFVCEEPYQFSTPTTCRAKAITSNNQEWSAEDMPCDNLLDNWSFEDWSGGVNVNPDEWLSTRLAANFPARSATYKHGTYSANIRWDGVSGSNGVIYQSLPDYADHIGDTFTVGVWVKAASAGKITVVLSDGVGSTTSTANVGTGWEWLTVTRTMVTGASFIRSAIYTTDDTNDSLVDGTVLIEGDSIPDSTFSRSVSTDGEVDAVPDIQVTGGTTHVEITQTETDSNYNTSNSLAAVTITNSSTAELTRLGAGGWADIGQTINCRKAGMGIIDSFRINVAHVNSAGTIICTVYDKVSGSSLGAKTITVNAGGYNTFTFDTPIAVIQDEQTCTDTSETLQIYFKFTCGTGDINIYNANTNTYSDGKFYIIGSGQSGKDMDFQVAGHSIKEIRQTFTVPETYKLSHVILNLCMYNYAGANPATVTIKEGGTTLGSGTATLSGSTFTDFNFYLDEETAHSLELSSGTTYTLIITPPSDSGNATAVLLKTKTSSVYANGAVTLVEDGGTTRAQTHDLYFKLYFAHSNEDVQIYNTADSTVKSDVANQILEGAIHRINTDGTGTIDFDDDITTQKYATTNEGMKSITYDDGNDEFDIADDGYIYYAIDCKYPVTGIPTLTSQINITAGTPTIQISTDASTWYDIDTAIVDDVDTEYELDDSTNLSLKGLTVFYYRIDCVKAAAATCSVKSFELDVDIITIDAENPVINESGSASTFRCDQDAASGLNCEISLIYADKRWPG